jgi:hypothetical protein
MRGLVQENLRRVLAAQLAGLGWTILSHPAFVARPAGKPVTTDLAIATMSGGPHTQISSVCAVFDILPPNLDSMSDRARLEKLRHRTTLRDLVIVNTSACKVEHWFRSERSPWHFELITGEREHVQVRSLGITIGLPSIYLRVTFPRQLSAVA